MQWHPELEVGHEEIDTQHMIIFGLINNIESLIAAGETHTQLMHEYLNDLLSLAVMHFEKEEYYLESIEYPHLDMHKRSHTAFTEQSATFLSLAMENKIEGEELSAFLNKWWYNHILREDMKYLEFIRARTS